MKWFDLQISVTFLFIIISKWWKKDLNSNVWKVYKNFHLVRVDWIYLGDSQ